MALSYLRIKCPNCDLEFAQEKKFVEHHALVHGVVADERLYVSINHSGIMPTCECGCGKPLTWHSWKRGFISKYIRGHNAVIDSCMLNAVKQQEFTAKRVDGYSSGRLKIWNKGLTAETSDVIKAAAVKIGESNKQAYSSGKRTAWQSGLTKETSESIKRAAETHKDGFQTGRIHNWSEGLSKITDDRLAKAALAIGIASSQKNRVSPEDIVERINSSGKFVLVSSINEYKHRRIDRLVVKCLECGKEQEKSLAMIEESPICFYCHPKESCGQLELFAFVKSLAPDVLCSDRTMLAGKELDVYIPSQKLAVEFNGLYYHSLACQCDRSYHDAKTVECMRHGIKLIHVFEDEWRNKREIVMSMIRHALNKSSRHIFARKCSIRLIDSKLRRSFFESSHLDGDSRAEISWGLFYDDELVSAMSLRKPIHMSKYHDAYEVCRFANAINTSVIGGLGKLTNVACDYCNEQHRSRLISYVDTRVGWGSSYEKVGFSYKSDTAIRFWWTDFNQRFDRFKVRANKSLGITQAQAAKDAGLIQIYGCKNRLFELNTK